MKEGETSRRASNNSNDREEHDRQNRGRYPTRKEQTYKYSSPWARTTEEGNQRYTPRYDDSQYRSASRDSSRQYDYGGQKGEYFSRMPKSRHPDQERGYQGESQRYEYQERGTSNDQNSRSPYRPRVAQTETPLGDYRQLPPPPVESVSFRPESGGYCYECGSKGHMKYECPMLKTPVLKINYCGLCHTDSHGSRDCPTELRKRMEKQENQMEEVTFLLK